ncbi:hypothetical protein NEIRO03_2725, partial [Nematocida sp. AWRm78]
GPHAITVLSSKTCEILIGSKLVWLLVALNLVDIDFPQIRKAHKMKMEEKEHNKIRYVTARIPGTEPTGTTGKDVKGHSIKPKRKSGTQNITKDASDKVIATQEKEIPLYKNKTKDSHLPQNELNVILENVAKVSQTGNIPPVVMETTEGERACEHRHMGREKYESAYEKVQELMHDGFVVETENEGWLIPIHLVKKPDGRWRFCLDLRRLNLLTTQDNYPLPKIHTITDDLRDMRFFTKLDIKDGFFRVPLDEHSQFKTTFKIGTQCYKFVVLPMGYRNAPNIFQRV